MFVGIFYHIYKKHTIEQREKSLAFLFCPLYEVGTSNNSQNDEEIYADDEIPQYEGVPADGTHHGTPTASQPLLCKLPNIFLLIIDVLLIICLENDIILVK